VITGGVGFNPHANHPPDSGFFLGLFHRFPNRPDIDAWQRLDEKVLCGAVQSVD
jgi:hypothetical protein